MAIWAFFLPLFSLRIFIWSSWSWLRPWLSSKFTPTSYVIFVFSIWGSLIVLIWLFTPNILSTVGKISLPQWIQIIGLVSTTSGLIISLWAHWILGFKTAILVTRIFNKKGEEKQKVVKTGPYYLFPHPIFLGEWLIILGCFLLTWEISLLCLLLIAFLTDMFAARGEEKDLKERFGKEYEDYRSRFSLFRR